MAASMARFQVFFLYFFIIAGSATCTVMTIRAIRSVMTKAPSGFSVACLCITQTELKLVTLVIHRHFTKSSFYKMHVQSSHNSNLIGPTRTLPTLTPTILDVPPHHNIPRAGLPTSFDRQLEEYFTVNSLNGKLLFSIHVESRFWVSSCHLIDCYQYFVCFVIYRMEIDKPMEYCDGGGASRIMWGRGSKGW